MKIDLKEKKGWIITMHGEAFNASHVDSIIVCEGFFGAGEVMAAAEGKENFELCFAKMEECVKFVDDLEKAIKKKKVASGTVQGLNLKDLTSLEIFTSPDGKSNVRAIGQEEQDGTRPETIVFEGTNEQCRSFIRKLVGK